MQRIAHALLLEDEPSARVHTGSRSWPACGSAASPDAGTPITDSRYFSVEAIALAPEGQVYALGHNSIDDDYQIRIIDPISKSVSRTILLAHPHAHARNLRLGEKGRLYFLDTSVVTGSANDTDGAEKLDLWCVDSIWGKEFIVDSRVSADDGDYVLSPDGRMVAFGSKIESILGDRQEGESALDGPGRPMAFSPDGSMLLDGSLGLRLFPVGHVADGNASAATSALQSAGDQVLLARWDAERFQALTNRDGQMYLEDLDAHTSVAVWKNDLSTYAWGDATHVFQVADARCTDGGGIGGAPCHRSAFTLRYRSLRDVNDVKDVAQVDARTRTDAVLLPDAKHFVWAVDGTLLMQGL